jgi:ribosomal protein L11 methyltransferase
MIVDGELAEAVAEVLARFVPNGVVIESTQIYADPEDEGYPIGPLRVCGYLPLDEHVEENRQRIEEALWYLGRIRPLPAPEFRPFEELNWVEAWKEHYHPIPIGQRLIIVPAWLESPAADRTAVRVDPGMAFGTGTHPTTQLCLELIETRFAAGQPAPETVIDIGCGSGILAVAALRLGARQALGVDIDAEAITASQHNAANNSVAERLELGIGSVDEVRAGQFGLSQAPLVLANILAPVLIRLFAAGLGELVTPGGWLVLSGILAEQADGVIAAAEQHGLHLVERRQVGDWVALAVSR